MPTFSIDISNISYKNLTFIEVLNALSEYIAVTGDNEIPPIIFEETGEIINGYKIFVDNTPYNIENILDLLPYISRFKEMKTCFTTLWTNDI